MSNSHMGTPEQETMAKEMILSDVGYRLGSHLIGLLVQATLVGVIICQVTHWIPKAKDDKPTVRLLVGIALTATTATLIFGWAQYMMDFVYNYGTYYHFVDFRLFGIYPILQVFTTVPVQLLFVERAVKVNGDSKLVLIISLFLSAATFAGGLSVFITTRGITMLEVPNYVNDLLCFWPTACLVSHLFNTTMIVNGLMRARTGNERSDKLLKKLIRGCLEAQIPGTIYAFLGMVVICQNPGTLLIPYLLITHAQVYLVGAMAMVNARHSWKRDGLTPKSCEETGMTSAPGLTQSGQTATSSNVSSSRWPSSPPWGLEVEMGLTEDKDAVKREEDGLDNDEEKRSSLQRLSFLGRGNN